MTTYSQSVLKLRMRKIASNPPYIFMVWCLSTETTFLTFFCTMGLYEKKNVLVVAPCQVLVLSDGYGAILTRVVLALSDR
jgi:hypothetical protein